MSSSKAKANLTAVLVDLPATGTLTNGTFQERSTRGWLDPENRGGNPAVSEAIVPGTFYRMHFDMQPKDLVAVAGRRLGIMIVSSDQEASIRPAAGTQLTLDLGQSWAEIPVVGGAQALAEAFGSVGPTVGYTLDPSAPTGQNGWYTGDVSLTWQVGDGGAAVTKTGCVDEMFTTDGTFTRSCTAERRRLGRPRVGHREAGRDGADERCDADAHAGRRLVLAADGDARGRRRRRRLGRRGDRYRVDGGPWTPYLAVPRRDLRTAHARVPLDRRSGQRRGDEDGDVGNVFTVPDQLAGLGAFVAGLGLDKGLTGDLLHNLQAAADKLNKSKDACNQLDEFVKRTFDQAGKKLTFAQAMQLLSVNQIEVAPRLPRRGLPGTRRGDRPARARTDDRGLRAGEGPHRRSPRQGARHGQGGRRRKHERRVPPAPELRKKIVDASGKGKVTAAQAAAMNDAVAAIGAELGC